MKTTLKTLLFILGFGLFAGNVQTNAKPMDAAFKQAKSKEHFECRYGQCNATAKSKGRRCLHCVSNPGDHYCYQHKINSWGNEIREELHMQFEVGEKLMVVEHAYPDFHLTMHTYRGTSADEPTLTEHLAYRWLDPEALSSLDWAEAVLRF